MKITLFGLAGTGTSTLGKILAKKLNYDFKSSGNMFRAQARKLNLSINEFDAKTQSDSRYDLALDQSIAKFGQEHDGFVIEGRLAWHFIPDSIKIKLACDDETRFGRIAKREKISFSQAQKETQSREKAISYRYTKYYDLADFSDDIHFDLIIDTKKNDINQCLELIETFLKSK